jgi:hypothetical protein
VPDFDAYLMVDWSASGKPATGADSVWYCLVTRKEGPPVVSAPQNPATRCLAIAEIRELLCDLVRREQSVLVGFDFPYGYPAGFADALGLSGAPRWLAVWREVARLIVDHHDNRNNRFAVAADLNLRISGGPYPFWGCPTSCETSTMSCRCHGSGCLPNKRITDVGAMQPIWKLFGAGSVGSQALVGIPYLLALRTDDILEPVSRVWPFETGLCTLPSRSQRDWLVLHAEIYPSLLPIIPGPGEVKDAAQVRTLACHFAQLDDAGRLAELFAGRTSLTVEDRERVECEESWTLGIGGNSRPQRSLGLTPTVPAPASAAGTPPRPRVPSRRSTDPGYENRNRQVVMRATQLAGTDHGQHVYVLQCLNCRHEYGANGSDIFQRRCPYCQGGRPGLAF